MSNVKTNDATILKLKEAVDLKKAAIAEKDVAVKFKTNKVLTLDGTTYNFNVLSLDDMILLAAKLGAIATGYGMFMVGKGIDPDEYYKNITVGGFHVDDWADDVMAQIQKLSVKEDKALLAKLEKRLEELISEDKKVELELEEIAALLK